MTAIPLARARILLIVSGGIAAYKSLELIRRLRDRGATVRVVMTAAARQFISPLSAATLSGQAARDDLFSLTDEAAIGHIELSRAADLLVVAPATANILARMAGGLADDLATTLLLATDKRVLAAPAMNVRMWLHPATRRNVDRLRGDGVLFVGPESGPMACGEFGPGRMAEPPAIVEAIEQALAEGTTLGDLLDFSPGPLSGRHIIVTSGPTYEPIDPVRFLGNHSSGRQGHAIAQSAIGAGARVTLITGPVGLSDPAGARRHPRRFGAGDAGGGRGRAARRRFHRRGGGRRLATRERRKSKDQKGLQRVLRSSAWSKTPIYLRKFLRKPQCVRPL